MKTNKKTTRKNAYIVKVIVVMAVVCVVALTLISILAHKATEKNIKVEQTSADLEVLYTQLRENLSTTLVTANYQNVCYQSSEKYSSGTITCGSEGRLTVNTAQEYEVQKNDTIELLKRTSNFSYRTSEDIRDDKTEIINGFAVHFTHIQTGTFCTLILEGQQYTLSCLETVPAFLPGYTVEE